MGRFRAGCLSEGAWIGLLPCNGGSFQSGPHGDAEQQDHGGL